MIQRVYTLEKFPNGRWGEGDFEMTSGLCVELFADHLTHGSLWLKGRIEHDGHDYFFLSINLAGGEGKKLPLQPGMRVRTTT